MTAPPAHLPHDWQRCPACRSWLPPDAYSPAARWAYRGWSGGWCRPCRNERARQRRRQLRSSDPEWRDRVNAYKRAWRDDNVERERERDAAAKRAQYADPEWRDAHNTKRRARLRLDPEWRERRNAKQRKDYAKRKAKRDADRNR